MNRQYRLDEVSEFAFVPKGTPVDKVKKHGWADPGPMGTFQLIHKSKLTVDQSYQREMKRRFIGIAAEFNWAAFGTISVNLRPDGTYCVIEGQHRVGAAKLRSDIDYIPCMVFEMQSVQQEAEAFYEINQGRVGLITAEKWNAMLMSGDPTTVMIDSMIKEAGFRIGCNAANTTRCLAALKTNYDRYPESFNRVWPLIVRMCRGDQIKQEEVKGLVWLEMNLPEGVSLNSKEWGKKFVPNRLGEMRECMDRVKRIRGGNERSFGEGVLEFVNFGCRKRLELRTRS